MEYIWNEKTNCFDGYEKQYETKTDETTGEETQVEIPCEHRLYTEDEVKALFAQCRGNKVLKNVDGEPAIVDRLTEQELIERQRTGRIAELKKLLQATDYQAIKYAEGELSAEEYEPIKQQRKEWREEINALETGEQHG